MKEIWNKYLKAKLNDINTQLILGISSIVLIATTIIALIFLTQYRQLSLSKTEQDLLNQSVQLSELARAMIKPEDGRPRQIFWSSLRKMTGTDLWIVDQNGAVILTTNNDNLTSKDVNLEKLEDFQITYNYSDYFKTKTLTAISPVTELNGNVIGYILLHKDVQTIYNSYISFNALIYFSIAISLFISILLGIIYAHFFTQPIEKITEVADLIRKRNYKVKTNINRDDQIGRLAKTIDEMSVEIDQNISEITELESRAKELVANVSHEFKTPLTLIRGYTMNLKDNTIEPNEDVYNKIINNTVTLEKLVNELLDLGRFQSGKMVLKKETLDVGQLISDVVNEMQSLADNKKIKINITNKYKEKQFINADYIKMRQLITIFLDNAIKYSNEDKSIDIKINKNMIEIKDHGVGIAKSELEQIFNRYYQVNSSEKGYGLGLCIAKYIAEAHQYDIDIISTKNKGTTIKIIFLSENIV